MDLKELYHKLRQRSPLLKQGFWTLLVILCAFLAFFLLFITQSDVSKTEMEAKPVLVQVIEARASNQPITITAYGTIQGNRELTVRPEVSGRVVEQSDNLVIGGLVRKGDVLLRIDPRNYRNFVEQEKAAVERAEFELQLEHGKQIVAKREWQELKPSIERTELSEELALRKPHLREKEAALAAAKSRLAKVQLDLKRTVLKSPINAIIIDEAVEPGEYLTPQSTVAKLVATDEFRVQVSIPMNKLHWIAIPSEEGDKSSPVSVIQDLGHQEPLIKKGRVLRLLGNLDPSGRMARLLVAIDDPLELQKPPSNRSPILIGSYVRVEIEGPELQNIILLPRKALREENQVWVMTDNKLEIRKVSIVTKDKDNVMIDSGIKPGELVVLSYLDIPIPGMSLQAVEENSD